MYRRFISYTAAFISSVLSLATTRKISKREATGECYSRDKKDDCECCEKNYRGPKCEDHCETCRTISDSDICEYLCQEGYYGPTCASKCPESCREGNKGIPICKVKNGSFDCVNGCKEGLFGQQCSNSCSDNCRNNICYKIGGACVGCKDNFYGQNCDKTCMNCFDGCFQNGTCKDGCREGYKGPMCNTKCLTSCAECKDRCSRQCQDTCPKTVMEICIQNSTCIYSCSGNHEHLQICPNKTSPPEMLAVAEASSVLAIVLPIVTVIVVIGVLIVVCYIKKKRGRRYNTPAHIEEHNDTHQSGSDPTENLIDDPEDQDAPREPFHKFRDKFHEIKRSTTNLERIELLDVTGVGSQFNPGIVIITESPEGKKAITQMLDTWKHYAVKGDKGEFTVGEIGSEKIASIHLSRDRYGQEETMKFITICLDSFKNVQHVIIVGACSVSAKQRDVIKFGDVVASVSRDEQPYMYVQHSDTGDRTFSPKDDYLQKIVKDVAAGDMPREEQLGNEHDSIDEVPNLHLGLFGTTGFGEKEEDHGGITAFISGVGQVLDSITGNGIESFLLVRGVTEDQTETAESSRAAASVVRSIVERIGNGLDRTK